MFPWLAYSVRDLRFPFSGSVAQDISPATEWFFGSIPPEAGDGQIEREIFDLASYGRQLGWITEVLVALAKEHPIQDAQAQQSLARLIECNKDFQKIKDAHKDRTAKAAIQLLEKLKETDPDTLHRIVNQFA